MNPDSNARLTFAHRLGMARQMTEKRLTAAAVAAATGASEPTARRWLGRHRAGGEPALADVRSRRRGLRSASAYRRARSAACPPVRGYRGSPPGTATGRSRSSC
ncbi:helix-turn-helix domain-containing protein [Zeimonas arvi]|uniref:Uncharacterized protein n=1 Tax=Zeimonas arvi TaxID=2498847 RepID=A0A5C8NWX0_9BURK|nr:hypothetical protein FHP08_11035 [Zeimonas arvi]